MRSASLKPSILTAAAFGLLLFTSCEFGSPTGGGTEAEGIVGSLTGSLVDPSGTSVANAWVKAYPLENDTALAKSASPSTAMVDSVQTNAQGTYYFPNLPVGTYNLTVSVTRGGVTYALILQSVVVSPQLNSMGGDTVRVAGSLTLQVQANGQAVAGATCILPATPWSAVSDEAGTCTITGLPPGTLQVVVSHPSLASAVSQMIAIVSGALTQGGVVTDGTVPPPATPSLEESEAGVQPLSGTLRWSRSAGALTYHLQLSTDSLFAFPVVNDSTLPDTTTGYGPISSGSYYWRVRAKGPGGTSAWSTRGFFVTVGGGQGSENAPDAAPVLVAPQFNAQLPDSTPFIWHSVARATAYRLQISLDSSFVGTVIDTSAGDTSLTLGLKGLAPGAVYWWRARGANVHGTGPWSLPRRMSRSNGDSLDGPAVPPLHSPGANATVTTLNPVFQWQSWVGVPSTLYYRLRVSTDSSFTTLVVNDSVPPAVTSGTGLTTRLVDSLANNTTYYWQVIAHGANGATPSLVRQFRVSTGPVHPDSGTRAPTPVLQTPVAGATGVSHYAAVSWTKGAGAGYVGKYRLQIALDTLFTNIVMDDSLSRPPAGDSLGGTVNFTRYAPRLLPSTRYHWRVTAVGTNSTTSSRSETRSFVTEASSMLMPVGMSPVFPAHEAVNVSVNTTLSWSSGVEGTVYRLEVATDESFANMILQDSNLLVTSRPVFNLTPGQTYYWRVTTRIPHGLGIWPLGAARFTTMPPALGASAAALLSPDSADVIAPANPSFRWRGVTGATGYHVQISTTAAMGTPHVQDSNVTDTTRTFPTTLNEGTTYYWRVRARNLTTAESGPWSRVARFNTSGVASPPPPPAPVAPSLLSPANAEVVPATLQVSWAPVSDAAVYHLQVASDSSFISPVVYDTIPASTAAIPLAATQVGPLAAGTRYYWRLRAGNATGTGLWSPTRNFRTED